MPGKREYRTLLKAIRDQGLTEELLVRVVGLVGGKPLTGYQRLKRHRQRKKGAQG